MESEGSERVARQTSLRESEGSVGTGTFGLAWLRSRALKRRVESEVTLVMSLAVLTWPFMYCVTGRENGGLRSQAPLPVYAPCSSLPLSSDSGYPITTEGREQETSN